MKVVLDTNCILQIVFPKSGYKEVWDALLAQEYIICLSSEIILEYREILERRFGSSIFAEEVIELIASLPNVEHVSPAYRFNLITADPDDNKFVDCAVCGGAEYIVSNDKHFNILKETYFPYTNLYTIQEFCNLL